MLRTALQIARRRLVARQQFVSPLEQTRSLSFDSLRGVIAINSNVHQNLSISAAAALPKSTQYQAIRSTSSDGKTGGDGTTNLTANERIDKMIKDSKKRAFLFMKGVPEAPQCGYSNAVVQILEVHGVEYDSFDVLSDEEVRKEIKTYSNWPTIPQLYVDKTFVGGCDILIQMHQNNELDQLFKSKSDEAQ